MKCLVVASVIVASLMNVSCQKLDDMSENAEAASDNSGKAATAASESREEIANSRLLSRTGAASYSRRESLAAIKKMQSFEMKVTESTKFLQALEFQLWTGQRYDTTDYLYDLYEDGTKEFFRVLVELNDNQEISKTQRNPFRLGITDKDEKQRDLNIYAMAVSLHATSRYQDGIENKFKVLDGNSLSMLDLIRNSLRKGLEVEKGLVKYDSLAEFEKIILRYEEEAYAILQARANMFLVMNLVKISDIKNSKTEAMRLKIPGQKFTSKFNKMSMAGKSICNKYLDAANIIKQYLSLVGQELELNEDLENFYRKMVVNTSDISSMGAEEKDLVGTHHSLLIDLLYSGNN